MMKLNNKRKWQGNMIEDIQGVVFLNLWCFCICTCCGLDPSMLEDPEIKSLSKFITIIHKFNHATNFKKFLWFAGQLLPCLFKSWYWLVSKTTYNGKSWVEILTFYAMLWKLRSILMLVLLYGYYRILKLEL